MISIASNEIENTVFKRVMIPRRFNYDQIMISSDNLRRPNFFPLYKWGLNSGWGFRKFEKRVPVDFGF